MSTPLRTLVADGAPSVREIMATLLGKLGHRVVTVGDGQDAYDLLQTEDFDILITDLHLPGLDGLDLCWSVKNRMEDVYIIVITSDSTVANYSDAIDAGADEFLSKDIKSSVLVARIRAAERIVNYRKELQEQNRTIEEQYSQLDQAMSRLRKDLDAAARMQRQMTPQAPLRHGQCGLDHIFEPAEFIGGDLVSYFRLTERHIGFYILDVAGHGVPSALLAASLGHMLVPGFLMAQDRCRPPSEVIARLNQRILSDNDQVMHFTLIYGVLDSDSGQVVCCQAGHPPVVVVRASGVTELVGDGGFPVGLVAEAAWDDFTLTLDPGDRLFLFSDGLSEGMSPEGEELGEQRIAAILDRHRGRGISECLQALRQGLSDWTGSNALADDLSIIAIKRHGSACATPAP